MKQSLQVDNLGDTTVSDAPAATAGATQLEETACLSSADPLHNGTAKIGTLVRMHGLTNEFRHLNFEKVRGTLKEICAQFLSTNKIMFDRVFCAALTLLVDAIK